MTNKRQRLTALRISVLITLLLLAFPSPFRCAAQSVSTVPATAQSSSQPNQQAYTLPPDKLVKAKALGRIRNILGIVASLWDLAILWLLLATRAAAALEAWTQVSQFVFASG